MWCTHIQSEIEKRGVPAVAVITKPFSKDAQASAELFNVPHMRSVSVPHPIANLSEEDIEHILRDALDDIVKGLTSPLLPEEKKTGVLKARPRDRILFEGTLEEVQRKYEEMGMTDGLPIIPPTEENLKRMLAGTSHKPDEVIATMPPELLEVTVEMVAINGIMAGCLPEHMPVLLSIAEALADKDLGADVGARSTNSFAFWGLVNGPVANEIGMNSKANALGPGNQANSTIGRAIRLFLINLGGSQQGVNDMSSQGNALKFGFTFAENEKDSPWTPLHVERGFQLEESTVTLFKSMGFRTTDRTIGVGDVGLQGIVWSAQNICSMFAYSPHRGFVLLLDPLLAKQFAGQGLDKKDIKEYLWLSLRRTVKEWKESYSYSMDLRANIFPKWYDDLLPDVMVPKFASPESITIVVVGGQNNPVYQMYEGLSPGKGVTKSIDKWK